MAKAYFLMIQGNRIGPLTKEELRNQVKTGAATADTPVWHEGLEKWTTLGKIAPASVFSPSGSAGSNAASPDSYYAMIDGKRIGPLPQDQFLNAVAEGRIGASTPVWKPGMAQWRPYKDVVVEAVPENARVTHGMDDIMTVGSNIDQLLDWDMNRPKPSKSASLSPTTVSRLGVPTGPGELWAHLAVPRWEGLSGHFNYGHPLIRYIAMILDVVFSFVLISILTMATGMYASVMPTIEEGRTIIPPLFYTMIWGGGLAYSIVPLYLWGGTPGKLIFGLRVVRPSGEPVGIIRICIREVVKYFTLNTCIFGIISILASLLTEERKALHDYICDTRVGKTGY